MKPLHSVPSRSARRAKRPQPAARPSPCIFRLSAALGVCFTLAAQLSTHAADILRGGGFNAPTRGGAAAGGNNSAGSAIAQSRANARDALARTSSALQSMKAMQAAARNLAIKGPNNLGRNPNQPNAQLPNVPNGLAVGGLRVAPGVPVDLAHPTASENAALWQGANLPTQTTSASGRIKVTVEQTRPQALLNWETFNIGKETTLAFDQSAGGSNRTQWVAFNKINDPSGAPSQILGSIQAPGQVYVINQNGIIFGGSSQVNLHALVASSLPINENLIARGLLNNPDVQFLFSSLPQNAGSNGTPAFTPPPAPNGHSGDVTVQPGARLSSPSSAEHVGGRIALVGPNVTNGGTISTPDGQTILAAGQQVGFAAHASSDPHLRGLDVYVGQGGGTATNAANGVIEAPRADVTMMGKEVRQMGGIESSTSVALNGRIDLIASYNAIGNTQFIPSDESLKPFLFRTAGTVTLGPGSATVILPEFGSDETVVGSQLALNSQANIRGQTIHFAAGADLLAPSANVSIDAGAWNIVGSVSNFVYTTGQIYLDSGSAINVAGSIDISVPVSQNIVSVQLLGSELADSPVQRFGSFRGSTIQIDLRQTGIYNGRVWIGTPLADASGYVGLVQRSVGELTIGGGTVKLNAGGSVVMQNGSIVDVSGGWIDYQGGIVQTSKIVTNGHVFDISQATPDRVYQGFNTGIITDEHFKWNIFDNFTAPLLTTGAHFEESYTYGGGGGSVSITAPSMALDGSLLGRTVAGPRQREVAPTPGALAIAFQKQDASTPAFLPHSPTPPVVIFQPDSGLAPADPFALDASGNPLALRADRVAKVILSPELLTDSGFGTLKVDNSDGAIKVPADVTLAAPAGGSITLLAANMGIQGEVIAPGGTLNFGVFDISPFAIPTLLTTPDSDSTRGHFTLGADAVLSTRGLLIDDRLSAPAPESLPLIYNGGSITINSYSANLVEGSLLDVSGGVALNAAGKRTYGAGGKIVINTGRDPNLPKLIGGHLHLDAELLGYSGGKGGSLTIQAPSIRIGGSTAGPDTLLLSPDFFSQGGFNSFALGGIGVKLGQDRFLPGIAIMPGAVIEPVAQSFVLDPGLNGDTISLNVTELEQGLRNPVSLAFTVLGARDDANLVSIRGDFVMGAGAVIRTDPRASVSIAGDTARVLGSIFAPAGTISVTGGKDSTILFGSEASALATVDLGPRSVLSTAGTTLLTPDPRGYHTGMVLPGGTISVSGNIVAERGALLDVSGATDVLDFLPAYSFQSPSLGTDVSISALVPTRVDSSGGLINLRGQQELFTDATLRGEAGGPSAYGGSLSVSSGRFYAPSSGIIPTPLDITLQVTQGGLAIPVPFYGPGETAIGKAVLGADGNPAGSFGHFAASRFLQGGFDSLSLKGTVQFSGPVSIAANRSISVADSGVLFADSSVTLRAPYVALGQAFLAPQQVEQLQPPFVVANQPFLIPPANGSGRLTVIAGLIDIGNLTLQGVGRARFIADGGDVRGNGTLDVAGDIYFRAGQVYPTTAGTFTIIAYDYLANGTNQLGSVTFAASGTRSLPLSAGGQLNVYGSIIEQGGVLRAPLGTINLGWDGTGTGPRDPITGQTVASTKQLTLTRGSVTSVSAIDPITGEMAVIPYGLNLNGTSWIDPTGEDITVGGAPGKAINISGASIDAQAGSVVDIRGGGDLFAYRWVKGVGGSADFLATSTGFAILPDYDANYAPYAPFNNNRPTGSDIAGNLGTDPGYVDGRLAVGDRVYLDGSTGLPAGTYTLLPARYALLPGAFLVTPQSGAPTIGSVALPDGASVVAGYRYNDLSAARTATPLAARFEVASAAVVRTRAEYADSLANSFLRQAAIDHNVAPPRLPGDSGQLILAATQAMAVQGTVASQSLAGGRGGLVDISSPVDILIAGPGVTGGAGTLVLDARQLSAIGAESLLIGGVRKIGPAGTTVTVQTGSLTVDNAGSPLFGNDLILVANNNLTVADNAVIQQGGVTSGRADTLLLGNAGDPGSGNGTLLRVSSDPTAQIVRAGVDASSAPAMTIGANARIAGTSLILDSTSATSLDSTARLNGDAVALNSGQISLQLDNAGAPQQTTGLVLSGLALDTLQAGTKALSLLSYSSIDIYGTGQIGNPTVGSLALHASEIRGFNNGGGTVKFVAKNILLDNSANGTVPGTIAPFEGTLEFDAEVIRLGSGQLRIDQFATVALNASNGVVAQGTGGTAAQQALTIGTPLVTGAAGATHTIASGGTLSLENSGDEPSTLNGGLGASLTFTGVNVALNSDIVLPSGEIAVRATNGDVQIGNLAASRLDVGGTAQTFFDLVKYTNGGHIDLSSTGGNVNIAAGSTVTVAAAAAGGDAGNLSVTAANGTFTAADGTLLGAGGAQGHDGSFSLDLGTLSSTQALDAALNDAKFTEARTIRVRTGDVQIDGLAQAHNYDLSADQGSITVIGTIDASGTTGGTIDLVAGGSVTVASGALLDVSGDKFSHAGKGGAISLEAGAEINGIASNSAVLDIQSGSTLDLSVAANSAASAAAGDFTGTLHLRAPQNAAGTDLQVNAINGTILNASNIVVEGYRVFDLTGSGGAITTAVQAAVKANGVTFGGNTGSISNRLLVGNSSLASTLTIAAGAELINRTGDLTLGTTTSTAASDWDLSSYRYGPDSAPGVLTLRAAGNLVFYNALSDGFTSSAYTAQLMQQNTSLAANGQSWSYRMAAGADFTAADFHRLQPLTALGLNRGSLLLGKDGGANIANAPGRPPGANAQTSDAVNGHYQVIRTGTGDIDISVGRDIQLLNQFATIYTAGTRVLDPTLNGTFDLPVLGVTTHSGLGAVQQSPFYAPQYSLGGGNVSLFAQSDISHLTRNSAGNLIADSERELPINWLYRRGYIDPTTGQFGIVKNGDVGSTTWWIDFSNFFEGVGALGGGDVTMIAGHDVSNVDGLIPTNARMPKGAPDASRLVELGGGDLVVRAGHNIDGGVYYVEHGHGTLNAGNEITTNATRSPSLNIITVPATTYPSQTWLPTTLFAGKASFDVSARGDLLLGPVANPFLLPEGVNNTYWYKTFFSTYATTNEINVSSLQGAITLREASTLPGQSSATHILQSWLSQMVFGRNDAASFFQPWLRLNETGVTPFTASPPFGGVVGLFPATLRVTSFSDDINVIGNVTLSPSPTGTLDLAAAGSINGLQINGITTDVTGATVFSWGTGSINLSDADPNAVPGVATPLSLNATFPTGIGGGAWIRTNDHVLDNINLLFTESGSTTGQFGVIQTKQALHAAGILHAGDPDPIHLYAESGSISDLTLFSGKFARIIAGTDVTSVGLYVQNTADTDTTVVAAGRDIIAFDLNSPLRVAAQAPGNIVDTAPTGDIQISGPGSLEVLAGRNFDLGIGPNNPDGTGLGLTSIGNFRNPALPFEGADVIVAAGVGGSQGLAGSAMDFDKFIDDFLTPGSLNSPRYLPELGKLLNLTGAADAQVWEAFQQLPDERQDSLALDIFYLVLRDAGRDHNLPGSPGFGTYAAGFAAIADLFPGDGWQGNISLTSREIKTRSEGNISLLAPGGGLVVGFDVSGNQAADQGILTEHGGNISIFTNQSVTVGTSRIFTLRGGNELIWSSEGDIAAGASSKTVQSAPPTRVIIDPQSADVATDLAGLATGGGIGVLATIEGVPPGDVDLIAPGGTIDAGDAGIRVSGNINIAAVQVLNASNIAASGGSAGVPSAPPAAPGVGNLSPSAPPTQNTKANEDMQNPRGRQTPPPEEPPSIISVEVLGFGGGEGSDDEEEKRRKAQPVQQAAVPAPRPPILAAKN